MSETFKIEAVDLSQSDPFRFRCPGDRKDRLLPNLNRLPVGIKRKMEDLAGPLYKATKEGREPTQAQIRKVAILQLDILEKYYPGLTEELDEYQVNALFEAWIAHSGISVGE